MADTTVVDDLLCYIIGRLEEEGANSLTLRLVKLLYLVDVEYYRSYGQTTTGLNWIRYKYGPYDMALRGVFQRLDLDIDDEEITTQAGYRGRKYRLKAPLQEIADRLPVRVKTIADRVIRILGLEDTNVILDYVYFHTEPMMGATWREPLNFGKIAQRPIEAPILVSLPKKKVEELRAGLMKTLAEADKEESEIEIPSHRDEAYYKAIAQMDEEMATPQLDSGQLTISPDALRLLHQPGD